jgi:hypothetical protein
MSNAYQDPLPTIASKATEDGKHAETALQTPSHKDPLRSQPVDNRKPRTLVPARSLPFPMNVNAPEPSSTEKALGYTSFETSPQVHRRRATLPSMMLSPADAAVLQKMWSSPDLQPAAASPSKKVKPSIPSPLIGVAVTSGVNPKRRSRSAGALHEMARLQAENVDVRRRSAEIRYWHRVDSHDVGRPASKQSAESKSTRESPALSVAELSDAMADTGSSIHGGSRSFDFRSTTTTRTNTAERSVNIVEQRLSQLEFNMQHVSLSLQEFSAQPTQQRTVTIDRAPSGHRSQTSLTSERHGLPANPKDVFAVQTPSNNFIQTLQPRTTSSQSPSPTKRFPQPPSYLSLPNLDGASPTTAYVPASGQLRRPSTSAAGSQSAQAFHSPITQDHLAPLYSALRHERKARKELESQVLQLRRDVLDLNTIVSQLRGATYPTPSPDHIMSSSTIGSVSAEKSRFSGYDSDDEVKGFGHTENWATPREELVPRGWGHSSEDLKEGFMF